MVKLGDKVQEETSRSSDRNTVTLKEKCVTKPTVQDGKRGQSKQTEN